MFVFLVFGFFIVPNKVKVMKNGDNESASKKERANQKT
jgi:hypothetical protein